MMQPSVAAAAASAGTEAILTPDTRTSPGMVVNGHGGRNLLLSIAKPPLRGVT
jgi:hypothetical protein